MSYYVNVHYVNVHCISQPVNHEAPAFRDTGGCLFIMKIPGPHPGSGSLGAQPRNLYF